MFQRKKKKSQFLRRHKEPCRVSETNRKGNISFSFHINPSMLGMSCSARGLWAAGGRGLCALRPCVNGAVLVLTLWYGGSGTTMAILQHRIFSDDPPTCVSMWGTRLGEGANEASETCRLSERHAAWHSRNHEQWWKTWADHFLRLKGPVWRSTDASSHLNVVQLIWFLPGCQQFTVRVFKDAANKVN